MATLASLEEAKLHLKMDTDALDTEITLILEAVTDTIFKYLKKDPADYTDTAGDMVNIEASWKFAALVWLSIIFEDQDDNQTELGQIPRKVSRLIYIDRNLSLA